VLVNGAEAEIIKEAETVEDVFAPSIVFRRGWERSKGLTAPDDDGAALGKAVEAVR